MVDMSKNPLADRPVAEQPVNAEWGRQMWADSNYFGKVIKSVEDDDAGGDPQAVVAPTFFERYIFNVRPVLLGVDAIRVTYAVDRPQTIMINGFMLQGTANIDSATYAGALATIFIVAIRTPGSTTFTIELRTTSAEGTDERLIGQVHWDGSAFDPNLLVAYELEGFGLQHNDPEIIKTWVSFTGATGVILSSHGVTSVVRDALGTWTITWDTNYVDTTYAVVGMALHATQKIFIIAKILVAGSVQVAAYLTTGALFDATRVYIMAIGELE